SCSLPFQTRFPPAARAKFGDARLTGVSYRIRRARRGERLRVGLRLGRGVRARERLRVGPRPRLSFLLLLLILPLLLFLILIFLFLFLFFRSGQHQGSNPRNGGHTQLYHDRTLTGRFRGAARLSITRKPPATLNLPTKCFSRKRKKGVWME